MSCCSDAVISRQRKFCTRWPVRMKEFRADKYNVDIFYDFKETWRAFPGGSYASASVG